MYAHSNIDSSTGSSQVSAEKVLNELQQDNSEYCGLKLLYSVFPRVMGLLPGPHKDLFSCFNQVCAFIREEVDKHHADWDPSSPRDFIDGYLTEIQKRKDDLEAGFHEEGLQYAVLDLFVAGTETTSTTLLWALVYMMKYPEIQEKVQAEIDEVVGASRRPNIADRPSMPYTDAVIHEVQRMGNVVPLSVPRMTNEDAILEGYFIPKFAEKYGDILNIRILGPRIVILSGFKRVKEVYTQQGDNLADRPVLPMINDISEDKGLVAVNGYKWKQQRRFALSTLRNFGLGKKSLEPSIHLECRFLNEAFSNENGQPFDPQILLNNAVSNLICVLVFGNRFEYSDHDFQSLLKNINQAVFLDGGFWAQLYNTFPWLMRRLPGPHKKLFALWQELIDFVKGKVNSHRADYDPSDPRDYIDCFLAEMEKLKDDTAAGFDVENLCFCTLDLFVAGTETTSTTLYWALLYMMKYPEIQAKVQEEIDRVVGGSRQPSLSDKDSMPYTNAVIHEIQRIGNIAPLNLPRSTVEDTQIGEYFLPKGTAVIGSLTSVLFDESEWETPHSFNPAHFLDAEGKFRRRDAFLPFSLGKRVCPGEQLARMELFLFFSSLLQRFTLSSPAGVEPNLDYRLGTTRCPKSYKLCAVSR